MNAWVSGVIAVGVLASPAILAASEGHDGGTAILSDGSSHRRSLEERFGESVNVRDFGAKGDGVSDDTAALRAAAGALPRGGGTLVVPRGDYLITDSVVIRVAHSRVVGYGAKIVQSGADKPGVTIADAPDVTLEGLWLVNTHGAEEWAEGKKGAVGITVVNSPGTAIRRCRIEGWARSAVRVHASADVEVADCTLRGFGARSLTVGSNNHFGVEGYLSGAGYPGLKVLNNVISGFAQGVFCGTDWESTQIRGNRIDMEGVGQSCVYIDNASNVEITDNTCRKAAFGGIKVQMTSEALADSANILIAHNQVDGCGQVGIMVLPALAGLPHRFKAVQVTNNLIRYCGGDGVRVDQADEFLVADNIVSDAGERGIRIGSAATHTAHNGRVGGNVIARTGREGLHLALSGSGSVVVIESNVIVNPGLAGAGTDAVGLSAGTFVLRGNVVTADLARYDYNVRVAPDAIVTLFDNIFPGERSNLQAGPLSLPRRVKLRWASRISVDVVRGSEFEIDLSASAATFIETPVNPSSEGRITIRVRNVAQPSSVVGTLRWGDGYRMAPFALPRPGTNQAIDFQYDGKNWTEVSRSASGVPN